MAQPGKSGAAHTHHRQGAAEHQLGHDSAERQYLVGLFQHQGRRAIAVKYDFHQYAAAGAGAAALGYGKHFAGDDLSA